MGTNWSLIVPTATQRIDAMPEVMENSKDNPGFRYLTANLDKPIPSKEEFERVNKQMSTTGYQFTAKEFTDVKGRPIRSLTLSKIVGLDTRLFTAAYFCLLANLEILKIIMKQP